MHFTPSRSKVSPHPNPCPAPTLLESHCAMPPFLCLLVPLNYLPWPLGTPWGPVLSLPLAPTSVEGWEAASTPLPSPCHGSPPDIPTSYLKGQVPADSSYSFFYGERCLILRLQMMNTVYVCALKTFYLIAPFFLSLLAAAPHLRSVLDFGGNAEHRSFFFLLTILF